MLSPARGVFAGMRSVWHCVRRAVGLADYRWAPPCTSSVRGAGTDSGQGGQRFLEKNRRKAPKNFFTLPTLVFSLPTLDLIAWVGKSPPAIT